MKSACNDLKASNVASRHRSTHCTPNVGHAEAKEGDIADIADIADTALLAEGSAWLSQIPGQRNPETLNLTNGENLQLVKYGSHYNAIVNIVIH